jgi:hypothetical protein
MSMNRFKGENGRKVGRPKKEEKDKKIKYGISIDKYLFDKMRLEKVSVSKFIQNLVKDYYEKIQSK